MEAGAAACGVGEDGVDVVGEGLEIAASGGAGVVAGTDVPCEGAAAALGFGDDDLDSGASEDGDGGGVDFRGEDLLGAACEEGDAAAARRLGVVEGGEGLSWREGGWEELEHGAERLWHEPVERFGGDAETGGEPESVREGECGEESETPEFFGEGAGAAVIGPFAERADEIAVFDAAGAGGFAGETSETAVGVGESLFEREGAFEDVLDEEDAAAGGFGFFSVDLIGGAGGEAESAMDASLDGVGHGLAGWS